jgi:branched-subunit amino acid ABC-type transport system permease component
MAIERIEYVMTATRATKPREERRQLHQQLSRTQLLDAAEEIFGQKGFHDTTLKESADRADFSVGSVYSFFENKEDLYAALIAAAMVALLTVFFQKTSTGRALRAVADDHQAAQSIGIPLNRIWVIVWCVAGVVALVAGMIWGSKLGVQFSLATVALRALPVVILGGLTSVPGAIIGGLIIGVGEKLSEVYLGSYVGGGIEIWFAYVLALGFLLIRPQGLFGEKIIDRV